MVKIVLEYDEVNDYENLHVTINGVRYTMPFAFFDGGGSGNFAQDPAELGEMIQELLHGEDVTAYADVLSRVSGRR